MCTAYYAIFSCAEKHKNRKDNARGFGLKCIDPCYYAELMSENASANLDMSGQIQQLQQQQQQQQWRCPAEDRENVFWAHDYNSLVVCLECR